MPLEADEVRAAIEPIASEWRADRRTRQARTHLDRADFDALRDTGLLTLGIPVEAGGAWHGVEASVRGLCEVYRRLAGADASVALVSAMHPAVISYWTTTADPTQPEWETQRRAVFASAIAGEQWGTITSEPGSGGDIFRTKSTATPLDAEAFLPGDSSAITGDKHFGSGMGVTDRMITTALPDGESDPAVFVLDVRDKPWDGTAGLQLIAEWDGMGMRATQSHAMRLEGAHAVRMAWSKKIDEITRTAGPVISTVFTAVILGVLDEAIELAPRAGAWPRVRPAARLRAGRVGARRTGSLARRPGIRRCGAGARVGGRRPRRARRAASQTIGGRARRADAPEADASPGRRHVLAAFPLRLLVRGRARARLPQAAVGARLRRAVRDVARTAQPLTIRHGPGLACTRRG